jgi:parvulin-like peptidyl-prolyl isomerase
MTFRGKPATRPAPARTRTLAIAGHRTLWLNIGFGVVIVIAVLILAAAAAASWYGDHFGEVANVDGTSITRDQFRDRYAIEQFRFDREEGRIRDDVSAGRLTSDQSDQKIAVIEQQRQDLSQVVIDHLIDGTLQTKLAGPEGVTVSDADVNAQLTTEATRPEQRHVWLISVEPAIDANKSEPSDAQKAAAKAKATAALADLKSGKKWEDVAKAVSSDASKTSGGDLGWFNASDTELESAFSRAVFAAATNTPTDVIEGTDGVYRVGRVTDVAPAQVDQAYQQSFQNRGISLESYKTAVRMDVVKDKLQQKIVAQVVETPSPQRQVQEIHIALGQGTGDEVKVRHILYAPNHLSDATAIGQLPANDPAWTKAKQSADAAYAKLKPLVGKTDQLETQFQGLATKETDDPSGKTSGGDLPYFTSDQLDRAFADAIFKNGLKKGDLIAPIKSQFGWHVILFEDRRPPAESRAQNVALEASKPSADFAALVRQYSDGPRKDSDGSLGWVARHQLSQQLEDAIFKTKVPGVSDLTEVADDGWYLFKVSAEENRVPDATQAQTLRTTAFDNWYSAMKAKATIKDELSDSAPAPSP